MPERQTDHDYALGLEDNAFSSLEHGVEHYLIGYEESDEVNLKFAVLHIFHAVELLLKARLAKADPLLIFRRPQNGSNTGYTVNYSTALERLNGLGVNFSQEDLDNLNSLSTIRNSIEHHKLEGDRLKIEGYVAKATMFLDSFVEKELDIHLSEYVPSELYRKMVDTAYSYQERLRQVKREIDQILARNPAKRNEYTTVQCDDCGEYTVLIPDPQSTDARVHCYNCKVEFYVWACDNCGTLVLSSTPNNDRDTDICDTCWDNLTDD